MDMGFSPININQKYPVSPQFSGKYALPAPKRPRTQETEADQFIISQGNVAATADSAAPPPPEAFLWEFWNTLDPKVLNELDKFLPTDVASSAASAAVASPTTNPFASSLNPSDRKKIYSPNVQARLRQEADVMGMTPYQYGKQYLPDKTKEFGLPKRSSAVRKAVQRLLQQVQGASVAETKEFVERHLTPAFVAKMQPKLPDELSPSVMASLNPSDRKKIRSAKDQNKIKQEADAMGMLLGYYRKTYLPNKIEELGFSKSSFRVRRAVQQLLQQAKTEQRPKGSATYEFVSQRLTRDYVLTVTKQPEPIAERKRLSHEKLKSEAVQIGMKAKKYRMFLHQESHKRNFPAWSHEMHKQVHTLLETAKAQGLPEGEETGRFVKEQLVNWKLPVQPSGPSSSTSTSLPLSFSSQVVYPSQAPSSAPGWLFFDELLNIKLDEFADGK